MFLTKLESKGFKSFAERINIDFVNGVTAVVGPNGSGKSNVIDAVRWVLGEQSAKSLRGQKMEDIIFQGSDSRQALNFAEVSITLNNAEKQLPIDYEEVNITRRAYRNGESEFLINKEDCRLKDIIDLFTDTGLGRSSFSIIGQGKIDEILSSKAEDRRAIFEEAAGVLKYKQRKKKAEFKLSDTRDNLDRVEDIIHEVKTQLKPLETQVEKAKKYLKLKKSLKEVEVALLVTEIKAAHGSWQALNDDLKRLKSQASDEELKYQSKEASLESVKHKIQELEEEINCIQKEHVSLLQKIEQIDGQKQVLNTEMTHVKATVEKLNKEKITLENQLEDEQYLYKKNQIEHTRIQKHLQSVNEAIKNVQEKMTRTPHKIEAEIEEYKSLYIDKLNAQAVINNNITRDTSRQDSILSKNKIIKEELKRSKQEKDAHAKQLKVWQADYDRIQEKIDQQAHDFSENKNVYTELESTLADMQNKLHEGNEVIAKLSSRIELLEDMKDNYQGFFFGVKSVLDASQKGDLKGVLGPVIDNIQIPEAYIDAMETVLGHQAQHIVTQDETDAREAINWLKKHHKGRATFLPLNVIQPKEIAQHILNKVESLDGFIGLASSLITVPKQMAVLASYLLGNVFVANDLKAANQIASITNRRFRIVTLSGDVVYPGGSMSGGSKKKNKTSLFTREKELSIAYKKLENYTTRKAEFLKKIDAKTKAFETLNEKINNFTQFTQTLDAEKLPLEEKIQATTYDVRNIEEKLQRLENDLQDNMHEEKELEKKLLENNETLEEIKATLQGYEEEIEQLNLEKETQASYEKENTEALHQLKIEETEYETLRGNFEEKVSNHEKQIQFFQNELADIKQSLNEKPTEEKQDERKQSLDKLLKETKEKAATLESQLHTLSSERKQLMQEVSDNENEIKGLKANYNQLQKEIQTKEVQTNRLDVTLENKLNYLQNQYKITFERAEKESEQVADLKSAKENVAQLKNQISRLGAVNLGAIDEFERLSERYSFLSSQQADLQSAQNTLHTIIEEMDREMMHRFEEVFVQIQAAFTDVFQHLFGGGFAALKLSDPDMLLETGIEIIAQPPGKKLKTLDLLSGGERALTAIALLFSILRVKPVPFCILDEVDAALDEANVNRFGTYLQKFSQDTQFIVITHRKGTMEESDALYGITMQESGVSRLVSVRLEEANNMTEPIK